MVAVVVEFRNIVPSGQPQGSLWVRKELASHAGREAGVSRYFNGRDVGQANAVEKRVERNNMERF